MRIAVYTLTRDRILFTKHCFETLQKNAGVPYDHFIVDNGSTDGTREWLEERRKEFAWLQTVNENMGISAASNMALDAIRNYGRTDLIVKFDNDCEVVSENILGQIAEIYSLLPPLGPQYILSPRVEGIVNQPKRVRETQLGGRRVGLTSIVGGLFHCAPAKVYQQYRYPTNLPLGWGQDDNFCAWPRSKGCEVGYIEGLVVNHYLSTDGQAKADLPYMERKWREMKQPTNAGA